MSANRSSQPARRRPRLVACAVGLGCWLATMLLYSNTVTPFQRYEGTQLFVGDFALVSLGTAGVVSAVLAALAWRGRFVPGRALAVASGGVYMLVAVAFCLVASAGASWPGGLPTWVTPVLGASVAVGCVLSGLAWGRAFKGLAARESLMCVAGAALVSAGLGTLGTLLPQQAYPVAFCLVALAAAVLPAAVGLSEPGAVDGGSAAGVPHGLRERLASFADVAAVALTGLIAFAFVMGTMRALIVESYGIHLVSLALCGALLMCVVLARRGRAVTRATCRSLIPTLAILQLASSNVSLALWGGSPFDMFAIFLLYTLAALLTLSTLSGVAHAQEFPADLLFATAMALFAVASFVGLECSQVMSAQAIKVSTTLVTTLYAFATVMATGFGGLRLRGQGRAASGEEALVGWGDEAAVGTVQAVAGQAWPAAGERLGGERLAGERLETCAQRCAELSARFRLTAREQEILGMLAQGADSAAIGEALYISQNTVRSHIHNLCRKTGAAGRAELVGLVEGLAPSEAAGVR